MGITEKIRQMVSHKRENVNSQKVSFIKNEDGIWKELNHSKETGKAIGVYSTTLGEGMFLTKVENFEELRGHKEKVVVLNRYDMSGHMLATTRVAVNEIHAVCPFDQPYESPVIAQRRSSSIFQALAR